MGKEDKIFEDIICGGNEGIEQALKCIDEKYIKIIYNLDSKTMEAQEKDQKMTQQQKLLEGLLLCC